MALKLTGLTSLSNLEEKQYPRGFWIFRRCLVYWSKRKGENLELPTRVATLLKRQKGKCAQCNLHFREEDVMEVDHTIPSSKGGKDVYDNWQLLHRHCHDTKTASDGSLGTKFGCNSAEPKPPRKLEIANGKWVMRCV